MDANQLILGQLQAMNARLDAIQAEGSERGRRIWEKVSAQGEQLVSISHRLGVVEEGVTAAKPTLNQVIELRAKADGAGWLGKKLLWVGSGLIALGSALLGLVAWAYSARDAILHWFAGR